MATKRPNARRRDVTRGIRGSTSDAYFYTPEWQAREREADEAIARGDVIGPFPTERAIAELHRAAGPVRSRKSTKERTR